MVVSILPPLSFSATGPRTQNEDSLFPPPGQATAADWLFMVCDGVGGAQKGKLASATTVEAFVAYALDRTVPAPLPDDWFLDGLRAVENRFAELFAQQFLLRGMATTLALLLLHRGGVAVAHVGDSRVYQVRAGEVLFRTADHSVVGQLLQRGKLTPAEAAAHPQKNVITRAIQGPYEPARPDVAYLTDLQPGDYFFLCSDGVWECLPDAELAAWLGNPDWTNEEKIRHIETRCAQAARDNYSGCLVQLGEMLVPPPPAPPPRAATASRWLWGLGVVALLGYWSWSRPAWHWSARSGSGRLAVRAAARRPTPPARSRRPLERAVRPADTPAVRAAHQATALQPAAGPATKPRAADPRWSPKPLPALASGTQPVSSPVYVPHALSEPHPQPTTRAESKQDTALRLYPLGNPPPDTLPHGARRP